MWTGAAATEPHVDLTRTVLSQIQIPLSLVQNVVLMGVVSFREAVLRDQLRSFCVLLGSVFHYVLAISYGTKRAGDG